MSYGHDVLLGRRAELERMIDRARHNVADHMRDVEAATKRLVKFEQQLREVDELLDQIAVAFYPGDALNDIDHPMFLEL